VQDFADQAHADQMRKYTPERYIVHPVRVMKICQKYSHDISVHAAALLHDVLEDTPVTRQQIHQFLSGLMTEPQVTKTINLVIELTDVFIKSDYPQLNRRKRKTLEANRLSNSSADAQTIKYADLIDNSIDIVYHDLQFASIFVYEAKKLLSVMEKGNDDLRQVAITTIDGCLDKLNKPYNKPARV
jgi:guanosine-3',5'-bis(diphosphate) 3'-pyrophosphohydrolase